MPSIKDLRKRITSVKNTQQTTKAMKMVSAAKLRRSQDAIVSNRPYAKQVQRLIRVVTELHARTPEAAGGAALSSPLLEPARGLAEGEKPKALLVLVTSDRGLCGGFNGSINKAGLRWIRENQDRYSEIQLAFYGRKGLEFYRGRGFKPVHSWEFGRSVTFAAAVDFAHWGTAQYLQAKVDEIYIVYNEFKNAISQKVVVEPFLPLAGGLANPDLTGVDAGGETGSVPGLPDHLDTLIVKPGLAQILEVLLKKHFAIQMYRIFLESQASEHGARMSAMESATRNAGEMIRKLTLQYNKQRQAGITKELLEIISGSESQKAG